ncbi:MAG: hypothetical protein V4713_01060 [Pseudomonadota bacterium]
MARSLGRHTHASNHITHIVSGKQHALFELLAVRAAHLIAI